MKVPVVLTAAHSIPASGLVTVTVVVFVAVVKFGLPALNVAVTVLLPTGSTVPDVGLHVPVPAVSVRSCTAGCLPPQSQPRGARRDAQRARR